MGIAMADDDFASFAELESVPGDDPLLDAGRAFASRYRSWAVANGLRQRQRALWATFFEDHDVVLAPVMPTVAFPHDTERPIMERVMDVDGVELSHGLAMAWCGAIGAVLLPVVTVPTGPTADGLPVGVQVIGPYLSDLRLLALSQALVAAAGPGFTPPPA
jgi:amidase